eukprot:TRINITY_DN1318_c0_g1_i1.p1 TRINITY_DN1318_c0_g1~~TRINITY_DN1318_c0_g1_i1.p1  ORF type:complete len:123 (-),score=18.03 TRINITY_DN1318_c0_g1_i1:37-405(-)
MRRGSNFGLHNSLVKCDPSDLADRGAMESLGMVMKVMLLLAAVLVASLVQGCGCTADNVSKCTTDNSVPTGTDMKAFCTYVENYYKCWKDAGCCDHADVKPLMTTLDTYKSAPYSCSMPSCS